MADIVRGVYDTTKKKGEDNADLKGDFLDFDKLECADTVNSRRSKGKAKSFVLRKTFLKPIENDLRGQKERNFYEDFWNGVDAPHLGPASIAAKFIPRYFGFEVDTVKQTTFIKLDNLEDPFQKPCVIDLKIGTQTYDEDADNDKIAKQIKKFKYQELLGYRITGMKVYDVHRSEYRLYEKEYGRHLTNLNAGHGLMNFFFNGHSIRIDAIRSIKPKLQNMLSWFENQNVYRFYGHSVLLIYEGITEEENLGVPTSNADVRLIDFAHCYKSKPEENCKDLGSIKGLKNILKVLESIEKFCDGIEVNTQGS